MSSMPDSWVRGFILRTLAKLSSVSDSWIDTFCLNEVELELDELSWSSVLVDGGELVEDCNVG